MIHPTAYVDAEAIIEPGAEVGPMAFIGPGCVVRNGVKIGAKATIECYTEIGENTLISPNAHLGGAPQDLGYKGEPTKLVVGSNNVIREFATIHRATTKEDGVTRVGNNCYIMSGAHIAHDCRIGNNVIMANYATLSGHTKVDDFAVISGLIGVHQFVRIGTGAMIAALSRTGKDVPPFCTVLNDSIMGLNVVGLRRRGVSTEARAEIKKALRIFTDKSLLMDEVKIKLEELEQYHEIKIFREFLEGSKRGITRNLGSED